MYGKGKRGFRKRVIILAAVLSVALGSVAQASVTSKAEALDTVKEKNETIYVTVNGETRKYKAYRQKSYGGWYTAYGCVETAVSIAASGFGKKYTPKQIHTGSSSKKYSEKYALKKMKASAALYGRAAISVRTAAQILKDMGIPAKARYSYNVSDAEKEIEAHLAKGKCVILKCNKKTYKGARIANGHHAIVLTSIEKNGTVAFVDPMTARLNFAHASKNYLYCSLKTLLSHYTTPASGNTKYPYVKSLKSAGGYILVG